MPSYLVTGGARGIGYEFVQQLSSNESNIVFTTVRNKASATKLYDLNRPNLHVLEADITDFKASETAAQTVSSITGGSLDVLINNAAMVHTANVEMTIDAYIDPEVLSSDFMDHFRTNVVGVVQTTNLFIPLLKRGNLKKVVVISTGTAPPEATLKSKYSTAVPYFISKAAVGMAVAKYALAFENEGFVFISLHPGLVKTVVAATEEEVNARYEVIVAHLRKGFPSFPGPISIEESVRKQLEVINVATPKDSGHLLSYDGTTIS